MADDPECFKAITIGKSTFKRYSQKAITVIKDALKKVSIDDVWGSHGIRGKKGRTST